MSGTMADRKLCILFVIDYYHPHIGGVELVFQRLAEGLVSRGHLVTVITNGSEKGLRQKEELNGVSIERINTLRSGSRYLYPFLSLPQVIRAARQANILHTATFGGAMPAFLASRRYGLPIVITIPEILGRRWWQVENNPLLAAFYYLVERMVTLLPYDQWVAISDATLKDVRRSRISEAKSRRIYIGVDDAKGNIPRNGTGYLSRLTGSKAGEFIYLYFGRPGITKGVKYLVQAAPIIQKSIPDSRLVLILSDQPRSPYLEICEEVQATKELAKISILQAIKDKNDLFKFISDANCIVVPSITEGFGLSAAEACSLGLPVIATNSGALPEVVSGRHLLIQAGSSSAIAEAVISAYHGEYDFKPEKKFLWEEMIREYEELYFSLMG